MTCLAVARAQSSANPIQEPHCPRTAYSGGRKAVGTACERVDDSDPKCIRSFDQRLLHRTSKSILMAVSTHVIVPVSLLTTLSRPKNPPFYSKSKTSSPHILITINLGIGAHRWTPTGRAELPLGGRYISGMLATQIA